MRVRQSIGFVIWLSSVALATCVGWEPFEVPQIVAGRIGMSDEEKKSLEQVMLDEKRKFVSEQQKLMKKAWERLERELPQDLVRKIDERMGKRLPSEEERMFLQTEKLGK